MDPLSAAIEASLRAAGFASDGRYTQAVAGPVAAYVDAKIAAALSGIKKTSTPVPTPTPVRPNPTPITTGTPPVFRETHGDSALKEPGFDAAVANFRAKTGLPWVFPDDTQVGDINEQARIMSGIAQGDIGAALDGVEYGNIFVQNNAKAYLKPRATQLLADGTITNAQFQTIFR